MSDPPRGEISELDFESALRRLEEVVERLEQGETALEESLRTFEEGVRLVRLCSDRLRAAEVRLHELEETMEGPVERPLEEDP